MAQQPQPSRTRKAAGGAGGSPTAHGGEWGNPAQDQGHGEQAEPLPDTGLPGPPAAGEGSPAAFAEMRASAHPVRATLWWCPRRGTGVSPHPSLSLCHLCFAVTDRQAPAHGTINYLRALFLNIDVKSKFPACPSPAFQMRSSRREDPSSCGAIGHCRRARRRGGGRGGTSAATGTSADTGSGVCGSGSAGEATPRASGIPSRLRPIAFPLPRDSARRAPIGPPAG